MLLKKDIGAEAQEARNLPIYLHRGYNQFVMAEVEDDKSVLYYAKNIKIKEKQFFYILLLFVFIAEDPSPFL